MTAEMDLGVNHLLHGISAGGLQAGAFASGPVHAIEHAATAATVG